MYIAVTLKQKTMENQLSAPDHIIKMGQSLVDAYGLEIALKNVNDNIKALAVSIEFMKEHSKDKGATLNLAYQSDFWTQVKQTTKKS